MADEVGAGGTPHCHLVLQFSAPVRFSTIKNLFPTAHIDPLLGSVAQARDYVAKAGKWETSEKKETSIEGTFEEWGTIKEEHKGKRSDLDYLYQQIKAGASDFEILENNPNYLRHISLIDRVRQTVTQESVKSCFRHLTVTYIYGETNLGKTQSVYETHGYDAVFRVTDYKHPFDSYSGQRVMCFDEYADGFSIRNFLTYLDGYPLELPCRYSNKWATYDTVYILSNRPLTDQYQDEQFNDPSVWRAFLRRITTIIQFLPDGKRVHYRVDDNFQIVPCNIGDTAPGFPV
jgi:hypothetical protein